MDRDQRKQRNKPTPGTPAQLAEADFTLAPDGTRKPPPRAGASETPEGLTGSEEALRRAAEGETRPKKLKDVPVFDRAEADPKD